MVISWLELNEGDENVGPLELLKTWIWCLSQSQGVGLGEAGSGGSSR